MKPLLVAAALAAIASGIQAEEVSRFSLRYIGQQIVPTGTLFNGVEFGGISGLDRAADGSFWALSDDRGGERGTPRFYNLSLNYDGNGFNNVIINSQTYMQRPDGSNFPSTSRTVDPEGIRLAPNGNLYWSSEGNWNANAANRFQPFVREMKADGSHVRTFATPAMYDYVDNSSSGGRSNKLFEALAVTPNGRVFVANEDALIQDGNITTLTTGSKVRVTVLDPASGGALAQYVYELPKIPKDAVPNPPFPPDNGLPELLALSDSRFIAVERAFASGVGNTIKLVLTDISGATDVLATASLTGASYTPMSKETLLDLDSLGITLDNIESIAWGQTLANGHRTLVLASDNNFSNTQISQFIALEVIPVPEPATAALLLAGLALLGTSGTTRRRN